MTKAINLRSYNLSESDKIVVMYSKDKGLIRGVAKGVKKPKSKLSGRMDALVANSLMLYKGKNLDTICQAEALNTFHKTRNDIDKLCYSMYCAEVVNHFGVENDPSSEKIYDLLYNCLAKISESKDKTAILMSVLRFQLKMMEVVGYCLELENCSRCSLSIEGDEIFFAPKQGGIICPNCKEHFVGAPKMNLKLKNFLSKMMNTDFSAETEYDNLVNEKFCLFCFNLLKNYVENFSSKSFKTVELIGV